MSVQTSTAKSAPVQSQLKPTDILGGQYSFSYSNLQPVLLLGTLLFSFRSLVNDPVNTLLGLAPTVALVQLAYCVLCLPSSGQAPSTPLKPGQKKKASKPAQDLGVKVVVRWSS